MTAEVMLALDLCFVILVAVGVDNVGFGLYSFVSSVPLDRPISTLRVEVKSFFSVLRKLQTERIRWSRDGSLMPWRRLDGLVRLLYM
ncbi:hypothetical protein BDZ91DRAFT_731663 [Kalaharituber pfeilii]|nr:hypothetical protein BDZ91DRAFT_731663 [Kalaharituber pfeilii]